MFHDVTGMDPPQAPVSAKTYAEYRLPFFAFYEEPTGIKGKFNNIKSVKELDKSLIAGWGMGAKMLR